MTDTNTSFPIGDFEPIYLDTGVAACFLVINLFLTGISLYLFKIMILVLRRQNFPIKNLLISYAWLNIILLPLLLILVDGLIPFLYPLSEHFGPWFCHISIFATNVLTCSIGMHTFMVALVRYLYILFDGNVCGYTRNQISNFVCMAGLASSILIGSISSFVAIHKKRTGWVWVNKCYGRETQDNIDIEFLGMDVKHIDAVYGNWTNGVQTLLLGGGIFSFILEILVTSNIPEVIMYCHIYWLLKRLVKKYKRIVNTLIFHKIMCVRVGWCILYSIFQEKPK